MVAKPRKKSGKLVSLADLSRAWEYHKNADQVLGARMSYGMIAQSMFLLSYVTLYLVAAEPIWLPAAVQLGIASFGLWYTSKQNAMAVEEIARMRFLRKEYLSKDRIFAGHLPEDHSSCGATTSRLIPVLYALGRAGGPGNGADRAGGPGIRQDRHVRIGRDTPQDHPGGHRRRAAASRQTPTLIYYGTQASVSR